MHCDVVDCQGTSGEIDRLRSARGQLGFADIVLLNKIDLVTADDLASSKRAIRRITYAAFIVPERCGLDCPSARARSFTSTAFSGCTGFSDRNTRT